MEIKNEIVSIEMISFFSEIYFGYEKVVVNVTIDSSRIEKRNSINLSGV